ncbi:helix-turn-helix domain-containing protein [Arthrobacter sp. 754]|uniref:helix-turn-helix domain-containing protein n=1 Tax=Arthrobacter sp. 754 TaxID=3156315 RepID=UPI00339483BE
MAAKTDYAVHPGTFLRDWLDENGKTQQELGDAAGLSRKHISELLSGTATLSPEVAAKLSLVTGYSIKFWLNAEAIFRADVARLELEKQLARHAKELPGTVTTFLRKEGYIKSTLRDPGRLVWEVLAFFEVGSWKALESRIAAPAAAFRQQLTHDVSWPAVATWLRLGEIESRRANEALPPYDARKLRSIAPELPKLSSLDPGQYRKRVGEKLTGAGVELLYVPEVPGCRAHGATRWVNGRPRIQLSLRGRNDSQYWFSLMHEIHHVLNDSHDDLLLQGPAESKEDPREVAADAFARNCIIPESNAARLGSLRTLSDATVFARELGIAPGLVVGRLHFDGRWKYQQGHQLFRDVSAAPTSST